VDGSNEVVFRMKGGGRRCKSKGTEFVNLLDETLVVAVNIGQFNEVQMVAVET
jgi:hypothetical protein